MRAGLIIIAWLSLAVAGAAMAWATQNPPQPDAEPAAAQQAAPPPAPAPEPSISQPRGAAEPGLTRHDFEQLEKVTGLQIKVLEAEIESMGGRISDHIAFLIAFIIVASAAAGFTGYFSARREAQKWINDEGGKVLGSLKEEAEEKIKDIIDDRKHEIADLEEFVNKHKKRYDDLLERATLQVAEADGPEISPIEKAEINLAAREAKSKPTREKTSQDWLAQGLSAFFAENYEDAAFAFEHASRSSDVTRLNMAKALFNKGVALEKDGKPDEAIAAFDEVERRFGDADETALLELVARALVSKGVTLGEAGKLDEAIAAFDEVERRFGDADETALLEQVAKALVNKGVALGKASKPDEAIAAYDEVERRFGDADETALLELVARALVNKGLALGKAGKLDEAIAAFDEVERRFGDADETALLEQVARALGNKGVALEKDDKWDEAIAAYDEVERRFGDADETALLEQVAMALVNKGVALRKAGKPDEEIAAYDEVARRFGDANETALLELVARALVNKGLALGKNDKLDEEIAAYDEVARRFGDADETALLELVAKALNGRSDARLRLAKKARNSGGNEKEVTALLSQALNDAEAALEITPGNPMFLGNKGYALFLLAREEDAEPLLRRALELGGKELRDKGLEVAAIYPLPEDEAFKELISRLWSEVSANGDNDST